LKNHYAGICASLISNLTISTEEEMRNRWQQRGITKNPARTFAVEFVDLFISTVRSRESLPDSVPGIAIRIDHQKYPAMSSLADLLTINNSPLEDIRRSDGLSSPLVILVGAIQYTDAELIDRIEKQIDAKIRRRPQWSKTVDRAILIAHDLPRDRYYLGLARDWETFLEPASSRVDVLGTFDEFWLVTCRNFALEALRICGR
jgi:hypothetical protein